MPLLGGVRPPIAALLCTLLAVAAFTALGLGTVHEQDVPQALRDAERQIAEDAADTVGTSINARATAVRRAAASDAPAGSSTPVALLRSLLPSGHPAGGGALLDPRTGRPLAASGETVPLTGVDVPALVRPGTANIAPRLAFSGRGEPRLLLFARVAAPASDAKQDENHDQAGDLREDQGAEARELLLVVSEKVAAPAVYGDGRTGQLADRNGKVLATAATTGAALAPRTGHRALPAAAANAANAGLATGDVSGSELGDGHKGLRRVMGWASVAAADGKDDTSGLGLTVLTARDVPPAKEGADHTWFALVAAGALVVITVLVTLVLWGSMQRPLLRLHLSAARLARGIGETPSDREELARPVPVAAFGEPGRAGRALESIRRQLLGETGPEPVRPVRRRPGVRALVLVCALVIAAWGIPLLFLLNRVPAAKAVPAAAVADQQARTEAAADRVRRSLGRSCTDLATAASALSGAPRERAAEVLRRERADHPTFRSLYVLDRTGAVVLRVGRQPLRTLAHAPTGDGITQVNTSGPIPAIAAYAQVPAARKARNAKDAAPAVVVAEIGVNALNSLVERQGLGSVWLTDKRHRVLAASAGFQAFQSLPHRGLTRLAARTEAAPGSAGSPASAVLHTGTAPGEGPSVAAAAPLAQKGPLAGLGWQVVSAEPAAALKLAAFQLQARTMLAGLLALSVGVACLSWLHIVVVRPLRAVTRCAERLAGGDRRTVLYPVHHDECGSVTRSLELLRQALVERDRGGGRAYAASVPAPSFRSGGPPQQ
ncbi:cache domain-containing protein [Streptomyces lydicamycinicus]|uniref:cache domain-containing protein n=1 Tax=Streptomyces lydicamycinicus TaxID=1546107 RepID=UPI00203607D7|nr:cache domain-containing protein [Streptomyces lydicamycinicus]URZ99646.1 cache domain-containing protein [Streptomyces lydicamycinicus]